MEKTKDGASISLKLQDGRGSIVRVYVGVAPGSAVRSGGSSGAGCSATGGRAAWAALHACAHDEQAARRPSGLGLPRCFPVAGGVSRAPAMSHPQASRQGGLSHCGSARRQLRGHRVGVQAAEHQDGAALCQGRSCKCCNGIIISCVGRTLSTVETQQTTESAKGQCMGLTCEASPCLEPAASASAKA